MGHRANFEFSITPTNYFSSSQKLADNKRFRISRTDDYPILMNRTSTRCIRMSHRQTLPQRLSQFQTLPLRTSNWLQPGRPWSFYDHISDVSGDRWWQHRPNAATGVDRWGCLSIPLVTLGSVPPVLATLGLRRPETAVRRSPLGRLTARLLIVGWGSGI